MEVVCVNIDWLPISTKLTLGKSYTVVENTVSMFKIICDDGYTQWIFNNHFKTSSEIRDDKLKQLGI